jgi:hypothetical protein
MSKVLTSPIKRFPGTVTISDPLTLPQVIAFERSINADKALDKTVSVGEHNLVLLPGMCACVEEWHLDGLGQLTPETFPGTPRGSSIHLIIWLVNAISDLYREADEIPNA